MIEAWKIGVSLAMTSNAAQVLGVLGKDLFGLGTQAKALTGELNLMKVAAIGAMSVIGGAAVIGGMVKLVEHGRELVHQQALMKEQFRDMPGMTEGQLGLQVAEATAQAYRTSREILTSNVAENLKSIRELVGVFGDLGDAEHNLTAVTKAAAVMGSVLGKAADGQVFDMAKALEIKGVSMDPEHFNRLLDMMVKASVASGGKVLGSDFFSAFKFGRTATSGWSDEFVGTILPTLMQEMKSGGGAGSGTGGPGNALQSAFQAVVGGVMSNKAALEFERLKLLDPEKVIRTSTGAVKGIQPGGVVGSAEFQQNPYQWAQNFLVPALRAAGISDPEKIREEVAHLFVNRTAQQIMTMFTTQQVRFDKDAALNKGASGLSAYDTLIANDPTTKIKAFTEAWHNLTMTLGAPLVDMAYNGMMKITAGMNAVTAWAEKHPETTKAIEEVAIVLAGLAVAAGALAIGTAAAIAMASLTGPLGFLMLVGAAAIVAAQNLDRLHNAIQNLLPDWLKPKIGADGLSTLDSIKEHGITVGHGSWLPGAPTSPSVPGDRSFYDVGGQWSDVMRRLHRGHPGYDANGDPLSSSAVPPTPPSDGTGKRSGDVYLDGAKVGYILENHLADRLGRPSAGGNSPDIRVGALMPGVAGNWAVG